MDQAIRYILSSGTLIFFVLGLMAAGLAIRRARVPMDRAEKVDKVLGWFIFFSVGVAFLTSFTAQFFFGTRVAGLLGRAESPFQCELALACLGFSAVGFIAAFGKFEMRIAALLGPSIFLWGMAAGRLVAEDFAVVNLGLGFWMQLFLPVFGLGLLVLDRQCRRSLAPSWF